MKRIVVISSLALLAAWYPGSGVANAQHGPAGGGMGTMRGGTHGAIDSHSASSSAGTNHASSMAASTNPGGVLDHNSHLCTKLEGLLGLSSANAQQLQTLKADASGFKNFGQFVAAVHVSHNLGIPFSDLRAKMTGPKAMSLGKAIEALKPEADAKTEAKKAAKQANDDLMENS